MNLRSLTLLCIAGAVANTSPLSPAMQKLPSPWFEPNDGYQHGSNRFIARGMGYTVGFDDDGSATYALRASQGASGFCAHRQLLDAQSHPLVAGEGRLPSFTRYYRGKPPETVPESPIIPALHTMAYTRASISYGFPDGKSLEYEFRLAPGADPRAIRIGFANYTGLGLDGNGDLVVTTAFGNLRYRRPLAWQERNGRRAQVAVGFRIKAGAAGFEVGPHETDRDLVIDPVLEYSTYLGGSGFDAAHAVATDPAGECIPHGRNGVFRFSFHRRSRGDAQHPRRIRYQAEPGCLAGVVHHNPGKHRQRFGPRHSARWFRKHLGRRDRRRSRRSP